MRQTITLLLVGHLLLTQAQTQKPFSVGLGFNSTISYQPKHEKPYLGQGIPPWLTTPNLTVKKNASEIAVGVDFFPTNYTLTSPKYYLILSGGQLDYKYHFQKSTKFHWFLSASLRYSQFLNGTPITGYYANPVLGSHSVWLKTISLASSYGWGFVINLASGFHLCSDISTGLTYSDFKVEVDYNWREYENQRKLNFVAQYRLGLSVDIYKN